jgi:hypothetical protein
VVGGLQRYTLWDYCYRVTVEPRRPERLRVTLYHPPFANYQRALRGALQLCAHIHAKRTGKGTLRVRRAADVAAFLRQFVTPWAPDMQLAILADRYERHWAGRRRLVQTNSDNTAEIVAVVAEIMRHVPGPKVLARPRASA